MREQLIAQLIRDEGVRLTPYTDSVGKLTIGCGRNLSDVGISESEMLVLLNNDVDAVLADLQTFEWFDRLDPARQSVLGNMRFNLGPQRFRGFRRMLAAVQDGNYNVAASAMLQSLWAEQVKGRAIRLAKMMRDGSTPPQEPENP